MKNSNETSGNRTRELAACSAVPQPTAPPRVPLPYLYLSQANLIIHQKAAYYSVIKFFNNLPLEINNVADNQKKFKIDLIKCLYNYSFYTLEEYFNQS